MTVQVLSDKHIASLCFDAADWMSLAEAYLSEGRQYTR